MRKHSAASVHYRVLAVSVLVAVVAMIAHIQKHLPNAALWLSGPFSCSTAEVSPHSQLSRHREVIVIDPDGIWVQLEGEVDAPGVYQVPADTRVLTLLDYAGGITPIADVSDLNLASVAADGEKISVPSTYDEEEPSSVESTGEVGSSDRIDINIADAEKLQKLPGVGPVLADRIIDYRKRHGRFYSVSELVRVKGIGDKTLQTLQPLIKVD